MNISTEIIKRYYQNLSEAEKQKAFEDLVDWLLVVDDLRYDEENGTFYWEANGDRLGE